MLCLSSDMSIKITAIRSDRIYRAMMSAAPKEKENLYRDELMKPACAMQKEPPQTRRLLSGLAMLRAADRAHGDGRDYFAKTFLRCTKRGRPSSLTMPVSPWMSGRQ